MYVINEQSKTPIFQINQHIGDDKDIIENGEVIQKGDGMGIDGKVFASEVLSFNDADISKLLFYINSQGGDVQHSLDMFNSISMSNRKTHSVITGFAFSCAGWIPLAADKVDMVRETGRWMCHMPYNPENPEEKSDFMDNVVDIISRTIASKSGRNGKPKKTQSDILSLMKDKTWWDAEKMHDEGLIDNIVDAKGKVVRLEKDPIALNSSELSYYYREYQNAQNKFVAEDIEQNINLKTKKNIVMPFPKVVNRLNAISKEKTKIGFDLASDADEDEVVSAISRLENRLRSVNDEMMDKEKIILDSKTLGEDLKNKMSEKEKEAMDFKKKAEDSMCEYNKMKEAHDKMEMDNKSMKEEKEKAENSAKESAKLLRTEKATTLVDKLIAQNRVQATDDMPLPEVREFLINKATDNYEDVATQFSFIPVRATAPKMAKNGEDVRLGKGKELEMNDLKTVIAFNMQRIKDKQIRISNGIITRLSDGKIVSAAN